MSGAAPFGGRARLLGAAAALTALVAALFLGARTQAQDAAPRGVPEQPNVLVVMTDDQRLGDLGIAMPRTEGRIGDRGAEFNQAIATFPLCCPSRATYLTGQYAHNHGVVDNLPPNGGAALFDDSVTTAVALDAAGYYTGWVGKYLNGYGPLAHQEPQPYVPPGFDWWRAAAVPRMMYGWEQVIGDRLKRWGFEDRDYQTDVYARQAQQFLNSAISRGKPFFLTVGSFAPHTETRMYQGRHDPRAARRHRGAFEKEPLPGSPSFNEADVTDKPSFIRSLPRLKRPARQRVKRANRDRLASLLAVDELVSQVLTTVRRSGLLDETLVIFTSDNGFALGEHRMESGKNVVYDPSTRVPLLMRGPGIAQGASIDAPVANIDLAATIYDFTGVAPLVEQDGVSLFDVLALPFLYADRELVLETTKGAGIRTPEWLYAEHETDLGTELELYDLEADPDQLESVHDDPAYAATRDELAARLDVLRDCEGAECH